MTKLAGKVKARNRKSKEQKAKARKKTYLDKLVEKIKLYDDPVLSQVCEDVKKDEIKPIIHEMKRVLAATKSGIGLAASQLGIMKNIFITRMDPTINSFRVFINPVVLEQETAKLKGREGCLSYPKFYTKIERSWKIKVEYTNEYWIKKQQELVGYDARVFLHEWDHLLGKCLVGEAWSKQNG